MLARILGATDTPSNAEEKTTIDLDFLDPEFMSSSATKVATVKSAINSTTKIQRVELQKTRVKDLDLGMNKDDKQPEELSDDFDLLQLMDQAAKT